MINKFPDIEKLFGTPINNVPKPKIPFKAKTWHYVAGAAVIGLAIYGGYTIITKIKERKKETQDPLPHYPKKSFQQKPMVTVPLPKKRSDSNEVKKNTSKI